jgi:hypothetical protein
MGKRFDALRLDQRQAIIRGLFGNVEVLSFKEAGIEGVGRVGCTCPTVTPTPPPKTSLSP